jgi:hypothetical protein
MVLNDTIDSKSSGSDAIDTAKFNIIKEKLPGTALIHLLTIRHPTS